MNNEPLIGGGRLVCIGSGSGLAVEAVPDSRRGKIVVSNLSHADGACRVSGAYRLTRRVVAGTDMWHVRRVDGHIISVGYRSDESGDGYGWTCRCGYISGRTWDTQEEAEAQAEMHACEQPPSTTAIDLPTAQPSLAPEPCA